MKVTKCCNLKAKTPIYRRLENLEKIVINTTAQVVAKKKKIPRPILSFISFKIFFSFYLFDKIIYLIR